MVAVIYKPAFVSQTVFNDTTSAGAFLIISPLLRLTTRTAGQGFGLSADRYKGAPWLEGVLKRVARLAQSHC